MMQLKTKLCTKGVIDESLEEKEEKNNEQQRKYNPTHESDD